MASTHNTSGKPPVQLSGTDGNAFAVMGACIAAAHGAGWGPARIDQLVAAMNAGDYDHLLQVAMLHFDVQ
jgi:hypothetical protein